LKGKRKLMKKLKNPKRVMVPIDYAVLEGGKRKNVMLDEFPMKNGILDIGEKTIELYVKEIKKAKAVFVKGPMGMYEDKKFVKGTKEILRTASRCKFSVLGGGHTENAMKAVGINKKKFSYVSLSGGATIRYLMGERMAGIDALRKRKK